MRKALFVLLGILLAAPAVGSAALLRGTSDGELSVDSGRGKVTVEARGGIIGRFTDGTVRITDLTPDDIFEPVVFGDELPSRTLANGAVLSRGTNVRFRLFGGRYRVTVEGSGIDLSAVGNGWVWLERDLDSLRSPGTYSIDGPDCSEQRLKCKPLPEFRTRFRLGSGEPSIVRPPGG